MKKPAATASTKPEADKKPKKRGVLKRARDLVSKNIDATDAAKAADGKKLGERGMLKRARDIVR